MDCCIRLLGKIELDMGKNCFFAVVGKNVLYEPFFQCLAWAGSVLLVLEECFQ